MVDEGLVGLATGRVGGSGALQFYSPHGSWLRSPLAANSEQQVRPIVGSAVEVQACLGQGSG